MKQILFIISLFCSIFSFSQVSTIDPLNNGGGADFLGWDFLVNQPLLIEHQGLGNIDISANGGDGIFFTNGGTMAIGDYNAANINNDAMINTNFGSTVSNLRSTTVYMDCIEKDIDAVASQFFVRANGAINYGISSSVLQGVDNNQFAVVASASNTCSPSGPSYGLFAEAGSPASPVNWAGYFLGSTFISSTWNMSDENLKSEIEPLENMNEMLNGIDVISFEYSNETAPFISVPSGLHYGVVAQQIQEILPELTKDASIPNLQRGNGDVLTEATDLLSVNYDQFIPMLIQAYKERQTSIEQNQQLLDQLQSQLEEMTTLLDSME
jgi:hypothetical protein